VRLPCKSRLPRWLPMLSLPVVKPFQKGIKRFSQPALAALLIAVMSFLTMAAPCASLHERMHHERGGDCSTCALCTMLQGHLDCPAPAPLQSAFVFILIGLTSAIYSPGIRKVDLRLARGRAPPSIPV